MCVFVLPLTAGGLRQRTALEQGARQLRRVRRQQRVVRVGVGHRDHPTGQRRVHGRRRRSQGRNRRADPAAVDEQPARRTLPWYVFGFW